MLLLPIIQPIFVNSSTVLLVKSIVSCDSKVDTSISLANKIFSAKWNKAIASIALIGVDFFSVLRIL